MEVSPNAVKEDTCVAYSVCVCVCVDPVRVSDSDC